MNHELYTKMPISVDLTSVLSQFERGIEQMKQEALDALRLACIATVAAARSLNTYQDQTGNLRSSIGYVIYQDGLKMGEDFEAHPASESGATGVSTARDLADSVAGEYAGQTVAVIVAGMNYAVYVESRGFDVITGPMQQFTTLFEQYLTATQ